MNSCYGIDNFDIQNKYVFDNIETSDTIIQCNNRVIYVHKDKLILESDFFKNIFDNRYQTPEILDGKYIIKINNFPFYIIYETLSIMYDYNKPINNLTDIYQVLDYFQATKGKKIILNIMMKSNNPPIEYVNIALDEEIKISFYIIMNILSYCSNKEIIKEIVEKYINNIDNNYIKMIGEELERNYNKIPNVVEYLIKLPALSNFDSYIESKGDLIPFLDEIRNKMIIKPPYYVLNSKTKLIVKDPNNKEIIFSIRKLEDSNFEISCLYDKKYPYIILISQLKYHNYVLLNQYESFNSKIICYSGNINWTNKSKLIKIEFYRFK